MFFKVKRNKSVIAPKQPKLSISPTVDNQRNSRQNATKSSSAEEEEKKVP